MPNNNVCTDKIVDTKWEKLLSILDMVQITFPASDDVLAHLFDNTGSKLQLYSTPSKDTSTILSTAEKIDLTVKKFSLWMLRRIIVNWIDQQPSSVLKRLLRCLLRSNRYYSMACAFILHNTIDRTKAVLIDKLIMHKCTMIDTPPMLSESAINSRHLIDYFAESSEKARLYFQIDTHLVCLQLRCPNKLEANTFNIFMLDCSRKIGDPWRWQSITEVRYLKGEHVYCPRLFDIVHAKCINKVSRDTALYEINLVLCTDTSVYTLTLILNVSTSVTLHSPPHVHKSHSTAGFLATLFDKQEAHAKKVSTPLDFFYIINTTHEYPYICIISPFLPLLLAVSGRFLESFLLERGDGGCTVLGVLTTTDCDPIIITAEGKVYCITVVSKQEYKAAPYIVMDEIQYININCSLWTIATTLYNTIAILEQPLTLIADQDGTRVKITEKHLFEDVSHKNHDTILNALMLLKSIEASSIRCIFSVGLLPISTTLIYVIAIGKKWNGEGFLAFYDTTKWNIQSYNTILPVYYLRNKKKLSRWAIFNNHLLCGPH